MNQSWKWIPAALATLWMSSPCRATSRPLIFPLPKSTTPTAARFIQDDPIVIVLPAKGSEQDRFLAGFLKDELGDRFGVHLTTEPVADLPAGRWTVLMGSIANPLVKAYCARNRIDVNATNLGPEGYILLVGEDATSLIFLHASAKPAFNRESYRVIWDQEDTADLLGWYEVVYDDGFVVTVPIRYGVNILEWAWDKRGSAADYCYGADAVALGGPEHNRITCFAYEWINPRPGKIITEVGLKGTTNFRSAPRGFINGYSPEIPNNGVILKAISAVMKRAEGK